LARFLEVGGVHKRFARVHAVADISFSVAPGEIFALLGPNGAGKSTLLRMMVGITRPDDGAISWPTMPGGRLPATALGYLPEDRGLYQDMPLVSVLTYFGTLRGLERTDATRAAERWLDRLELLARAKDKVGSLSKGNQQKVQFAAAVLHAPACAILDEPFSGLDPLNQELFLGLVAELRTQGTTVILSAHQMSLVERLADRVFVMQHGREVLSGTMPEIRERWGTGARLILTVEHEQADALAPIQAHPAVMTVSREAEGDIVITLARGHHVGDLLALCASRLNVVRVRTEEPSPHDVYINVVGGAAAQIANGDGAVARATEAA
jgi:ABC-2 type transport system ATP-binding protein